MTYTRQQVDDGRIQLLKKSRSFVQADIYLVEIDGKRLVHKDFSRRHVLWRWLIGRTVIAREARAHRQLEHVRGVPRLVALPDRFSMVIEFIDGKPLSKYRRQHNLTPDLFERLNDLIREMHSHGVAHGDLHKRNFFISQTGEPYILDFATANCIDKHSGWLRRQIFNRMCKVDFLGIMKMKAKYKPHLLTESEKKALENIPFYLKLGRFFRKKIYRPFIKTKTWQRRWEALRDYFEKKR